MDALCLSGKLIHNSASPRQKEYVDYSEIHHKYQPQHTRDLHAHAYKHTCNGNLGGHKNLSTPKRVVIYVIIFLFSSVLRVRLITKEFSVIAMYTYWDLTVIGMINLRNIIIWF